MEEDLFNEIKQSEGIDEPCLSSKEDCEWRPVAKDPYENAPEEVKKYHELYESLWLKHLKGR